MTEHDLCMLFYHDFSHTSVNLLLCSIWCTYCIYLLVCEMQNLFFYVILKWYGNDVRRRTIASAFWFKHFKWLSFCLRNHFCGFCQHNKLAAKTVICVCQATNRMHPQTVTGAYLSGIREVCRMLQLQSSNMWLNMCTVATTAVVLSAVPQWHFLKCRRWLCSIVTHCCRCVCLLC